MLHFFWPFARRLETSVREDDHAGLYKHLNMMNLDGKRDRSSKYIKCEDRILLRDVKRIRRLQELARKKQIPFLLIIMFW